MEGKLGWLAEGAMNPIQPQYRDWEKNDYEHPTSQPGAGASPPSRPNERKPEAA